MNAKQPLRSWLRPDLDDARIARQWAGVEAHLDRARRPRWLWGMVVAGAVAGTAAVSVGIARWVRTPNLVSSAQPSSSVLVLADGSHVTLDGGAKLEVRRNEPADIATHLESGAALFDVVPNHERGFVVEAGGIEVRVIGTRFRVDLASTSSDVTVTVLRGIVEVRSKSHPDEVHRVSSGESWSTRAEVEGHSPPASPSVEASTVAADSAIPEAAPSGSKPAISEPASSGPKRRVDTQAPDTADQARTLFESANRARHAGDLGRASALYRELTRQYPNDPRAKVAALELARIEMDRGHEATIAEEALRTASSAEAGSSVQEDALARLVQLYATKGDTRACLDTRARYLTAYPSGVHAAQVRAACAPH